MPLFYKNVQCGNPAAPKFMVSAAEKPWVKEKQVAKLLADETTLQGSVSLCPSGVLFMGERRRGLRFGLSHIADRANRRKGEVKITLNSYVHNTRESRQY